MNNKTFETIEKTIVRLESCLETDTTLGFYNQELIREAIENLVKIYENSKTSNPS